MPFFDDLHRREAVRGTRALVRGFHDPHTACSLRNIEISSSSNPRFDEDLFGVLAQTRWRKRGRDRGTVDVYSATEDGNSLVSFEIYFNVVDEGADFHLLLIDCVCEREDLADRHSGRNESLLPLQGRMFAEGLFQLNGQEVAVALAQFAGRVKSVHLPQGQRGPPSHRPLRTAVGCSPRCSVVRRPCERCPTGTRPRCCCRYVSPRGPRSDALT